MTAFAHPELVNTALALGFDSRESEEKTTGAALKAFFVKVPAAEAGLEVVETTRARSGLGAVKDAEEG